MTQPPRGLGQRLERETDRRIGHPDAEAGDAGLGQRIWGRYGDSPGVISMTAALGLTHRIHRWSTDRLPLLAGVQRRWMPADAFSTLGSTALPYTRRPVVAPVRSLSTDPASPVSGKPPPAFGGVGSRPVTAAPARVQRATVVPSVEDVERPNPLIGGTRGRATSEGSRQGQTVSPPTVAASSQGTVGLPRDPGSSTGQAVQRKVTLPAPPTGTGQKARSSTLSGEGVPSPQPVLRVAPKRTEAEMASPVTSRTRERGTAVLRRQAVRRRDTAPELADLTLARATEVHTKAGSPTLPDEGAPRPQPVARETPGSTGAETDSPVSASARALGTAILQRHLGGPAGRAVQSVGRVSITREPAHLARRPATEAQTRAGRPVSPDEGVPRLRLAAGGAQRSPESWTDAGAKIGGAEKNSPWDQFSPPYGRSSRIAQGAVPHGQTNLNSIQMASLSVTRVGDPGTSIVQRYLGARAGIHEARQETLATPQIRGRFQRQHAWGQVSPGAGTEARGMIQRHLGEVVPSDIGGPQQVPKDAFASKNPTGLAVPPMIQRVVWSPATHSGGMPGASGPRLPLFASSGPGVGRATAAGSSGGTLPARRWTAPPMSAGAPVAGAAGSRPPPLIQTRKDYFDDPPAMPLQRATAESQAAGPAGASVDTVPSPSGSESTSSPENLDLERLADQIYAILERRLTIERESLGL